MNDNNFFATEDENESFRDIPDEVTGESAPAASIPRGQRSVAPQPSHQSRFDLGSQGNEEIVEEVLEQLESEEEDFSSVLNDARFRLEQGRLYEMIMNHNMFEGSDADEKAIKFVQKQIRGFAKEQMEIMLGMRQEASKDAPIAYVSPFNDLEVQTLKALASAATKGATAAPEAQTYTNNPETPKRSGLNPIGLKQQNKALPTRVAPVNNVSKPLAKNPQAPIKRTRTDLEIDKILAEEGITRAEYEAQYPPDYKPLEKPFEKMSDAELKERAKQVYQRHAGQVKNPAALPMPTAEQEEMLHTQRAQAAASHPQMKSIMNLLLTQPKKA